MLREDQGQTTKVLLRAALDGRVPRQAFDRAKHGFTAPIGRWLRRELREFVEDILFGLRAQQRGFFNPRAVSQLWTKHLQEVHDASHDLWLLLMLELWFQRFMDRSSDGVKP